MAAENDGKPVEDRDIQTLKTLITENTLTSLIAMKLDRTEDSIRDKVAAEGLVARTNKSKPTRLKTGLARADYRRGRWEA